MHWLIRHTMRALYPATDGLPGIEDTGLAEFLVRYQRDSTLLMWLGLLLGTLAFVWSPLFTIFVPLPSFLLPRSLLDKHAYRVCYSRIYLLRQAVFLVKLAAGLCWGAHETVRAKMALPPYPEDPGTVRGQRVSHTAYQERGKDLRLETDYVVVGTGAGGASFGVTLARAGAKVALVEAGPWRDPEHYPSSTYGAMRDMFDDWGTQITRSRAFWPIVQARTVGGTTVINSAICVRTPADIFERWQTERSVGDGMAERVWAYQDRIEEELCVEEVPEAARGNSNRLAMLGAEGVGYESHWIKRYVKACEGSGQCLQGCRKLRKQSTNLNYVPEVLERGGEVLSSAPVDRVLFEGKRAVGVAGHFVNPTDRRRGARFEVRAKKAVIIAASATHSPALLQRSGVKNRALGKYFRAHPGTGVFGVYDEPVDMNVGATQGWASMAFRDDPGMKLETLSIPLEMVASRLGGGGVELMRRLSEYRHICMWVHAVRAESAGTVRNGFGNKPVVKYVLDREDMLRFRAGMHLVAKTHVAAGAKKIIPGIFGLPYELEPDQVDTLLEAPLDPRNYIAVLSHLFGGCTMGTDAKDAVTDSSGRVHGYENLVVADASVIPSNLGVNPQHTIMALAMMFAEDLLDA